MRKDISEYFQITPEFIDAYNEKVRIGREYLSGLNVGILCIARDLEATHKQFFNTYETIKNITNKTRLFIYENDSVDNTVNILKHYKENDKDFDYISENLNRVKYGQSKDLERTQRLSSYRNKCLEYAKDHFHDTDYIVVLDCDFADFSVGGLVNSFGWLKTNPEIDGIAGFSYEYKNTLWNNKSLWNYDCWAFRWTWWEDQQKFQYSPQNTMLWFGLWIPVLGSPVFKVNSAFGGCATYKTKLYLEGKYSGEDCEHVTMHKYLNDTNQFNLYVNPSQVMLF